MSLCRRQVRAARTTYLFVASCENLCFPIAGKSCSTAANLLTTSPPKPGGFWRYPARYKTMHLAAGKSFETAMRSGEPPNPRPKRPQPKGFRSKTPATSLLPGHPSIKGMLHHRASAAGFFLPKQQFPWFFNGLLNGC